MRKALFVVAAIAVVGAAGLIVAQQEFPNPPQMEIKLDNDKVVVQQMSWEPGQWSGEHAHEGGQIVVVLDEIKMLYKENGEEVERTFPKGHVFMIEPTTHDHKALSDGSAILITLK